MPSIFLILKKNSENKSGMEIDMMNDRIGISLYKTEYEQYSILSRGVFQPLLHSSVIFPTLIYVFENLKNSELENFEEYSWFKTIKKVLSNMNIELNKETLELAAKIRAERRLAELRSKGDETSSLEDVLENLSQRDYIDTHREVAPLKQAEDAIVLDNSHLTIAEQDALLRSYFERATQD